MLEKNVIFQGDGLKKMPIIDLANIERGVKGKLFDFIKHL